MSVQKQRLYFLVTTIKGTTYRHPVYAFDYSSAIEKSFRIIPKTVREEYGIRTIITASRS